MVRRSVEVAVPVRTAYDQWSQLETFPRFLQVVHEVEVSRPTLTRWVVGYGPLRHEFLAEVLEQQPDEHLRWRSLGRRLRHRGDVHFRALGPARCEVTVAMQMDAPPLLGPAARLLAGRFVTTLLESFRAFIEGVGAAGLSWRGGIRDGRVEDVGGKAPDFPEWPHG